MPDNNDPKNPWEEYYQENLVMTFRMISNAFSFERNNRVYEGLKMGANELGHHQLPLIKIFIDDDLYKDFEEEWNKFWNAPKGNIEVYETRRGVDIGNREKLTTIEKPSGDGLVAVRDRTYALERGINQLEDFRRKINEKITLAFVANQNSEEIQKLNDEEARVYQELNGLKDQIKRIKKNFTNRDGKEITVDAKILNSIYKEEKKIAQKLNLLNTQYKSLEFQIDQFVDPNNNIKAAIKRVELNKDYLGESYDYVKKSHSFMEEKFKNYSAQLKSCGASKEELAAFQARLTAIIEEKDRTDAQIKQIDEELNKLETNLENLNDPSLTTSINQQAKEILKMQKTAVEKHDALINSHIQLEYDMGKAFNIKSNPFPSVLRALSVTKFLNPLNYIKFIRVGINTLNMLTMMGVKKIFSNESTAGKIVFFTLRAPLTITSAILKPIADLDEMPLVKSVVNFLKNPIAAFSTKNPAPVASQENKPLMKTSSKRMSSTANSVAVLAEDTKEAAQVLEQSQAAKTKPPAPVKVGENPGNTATPQPKPPAQTETEAATIAPEGGRYSEPESSSDHTMRFR